MGEAQRAGRAGVMLGRSRTSRGRSWLGVKTGIHGIRVAWHVISGRVDGRQGGALKPWDAVGSKWGG